MKTLMAASVHFKPKDNSHFHVALAELLRINVAKKNRGEAVASTQTQQDRTVRIHLIFDDLRSPDKLNMPIKNPKNLKPHHIVALVDYWLEKGLGASTIENRLSLLRTLALWIGKRDIVKPMAFYAPGVKRTYAAQIDMSPSANGYNAMDVFQKIYEKDKYVGMQVLLAIVFGARRKECVRFYPLLNDKDTYIILDTGTKGGKERHVPVDTPEKRAALDLMKEFAYKAHLKAKAHLGNPNNTLKQNLRRYTYVMERLGYTKENAGFTGHNFRQEFLINELMKRGIVPTIRGGSGSIDVTPSSELLGKALPAGTEQAGIVEQQTGQIDPSSSTTGEPARAAGTDVGGDSGKRRLRSDILVQILGAPTEQAGIVEQQKDQIDPSPSSTGQPTDAARTDIGGDSVKKKLSKAEMKYRQVLTDVAYLQVSRLAGHFRKSVMTAYSGPLRPRKWSEYLARNPARLKYANGNAAAADALGALVTPLVSERE